MQQCINFLILRNGIVLYRAIIFPAKRASCGRLIHGIGEHAGRFSRVADYFNHAGIAVVSMDLRGHGRSQGVRGACAPRAEVLRDIDALIEYAQAFYPGCADCDVRTQHGWQYDTGLPRTPACTTMCRLAISFRHHGFDWCVRSAAVC